MMGITSHGVTPASGPEWRFKHVGYGTLKVAVVPGLHERRGQEGDTSASSSLARQERDSLSTSPILESSKNDSSSSSSSNDNDNDNNDLATLLTKAGPILDTQILSYSDFLIAQFEKLVCNLVINPLTAIYGCYNGELLALDSLGYFMHRLVGEASAAFLADMKARYPELVGGSGGVATGVATGGATGEPAAGGSGKFSTALHPDRLNSIVVDVLTKTAQNKSSMLQDVQALRDLEIDYINGHIVQLARKYGTGAIHNRMVMEMIKSKLSLDRDRERRSAPIINA